MSKFWPPQRMTLKRIQAKQIAQVAGLVKRAREGGQRDEIIYAELVAAGWPAGAVKAAMK